MGALQEKRETKKGKKESFKAEIFKRLSPTSKYYCFSHSISFWNSNIFLVGQPWCSTILFNVLWPLHFEISLVVRGNNQSNLKLFNDVAAFLNAVFVIKNLLQNLIK